MRRLTRFLLPILLLVLLSGCAITHEFGPYQGKVVDKETGEPIEGAVVFLRFYTGTIWAVGGRVSHFADAVEVLTDAKGEFNIPPQKVFVFRPGDTWDQDPLVIIFKPGYGAFPSHLETTDTDTDGTLPANEPITIELPKLIREERGRNVSNALSFSIDVPYEKYKQLFDAVNQERVFLGGAPYSIPGARR